MNCALFSNIFCLSEIGEYFHQNSIT